MTRSQEAGTKVPAFLFDVKTYCRRCLRRIYLTKVTSDTSAHRRRFLDRRRKAGPDQSDLKSIFAVRMQHFF